MRILFRGLIFSILFLAAPAEAKLVVVTTTMDLAAITREVGGSEISVESIAKGSQDPHFIEAKPSYMVKLSKADLLIAVGLDLEIGWLPSLVQGARNPKVNRGQVGYLEVGPQLTPLEVPSGKVSRADGDVHPFGNPHVTLDPLRAGEIAEQISLRLAQLDSAHAELFKENAKNFHARMREKTKNWAARISKSGVKKVVSYHRTLSYFFDRFKLENPVILEPKPGIPPTSGHILQVIQRMKADKIQLILVENFFDPTVTQKILTEVPGTRTATVPVAVGGEKGVDTLDDLYEALVKAVAGS